MKKLNNSGFSLIELIIVMAIMAILTIAVAPQYLKYVERSRKAVDVQTMATIITAIDIYMADPVVATDDLVKDDATLTLSTTSTAVTAAASANGNIDKALENAGIKEVALKSSKWNTNGEVVLKVDVDGNGVPSYSASCTTGDIIKGVTEGTTSSNN